MRPIINVRGTGTSLDSWKLDEVASTLLIILLNLQCGSYYTVCTTDILYPERIAIKFSIQITGSISVRDPIYPVSTNVLSPSPHFFPSGTGEISHDVTDWQDVADSHNNFV